MELHLTNLLTKQFQGQVSEIRSYVAPGVDKLMEAAHVLLVARTSHDCRYSVFSFTAPAPSAWSPSGANTNNLELILWLSYKENASFFFIYLFFLQSPTYILLQSVACMGNKNCICSSIQYRYCSWRGDVGVVNLQEWNCCHGQMVHHLTFNCNFFVAEMVHPDMPECSMSQGVQHTV